MRDRPIPSNHWDSSLFYQNFGVGLWSYPLEVDTNGEGFQVYLSDQMELGRPRHGYRPSASGSAAKDFKPTGTKAKDWSDWMDSFRLGESADQIHRCNLGRRHALPLAGMPWRRARPSVSMRTATYFDLKGAPLTLAVSRGMPSASNMADAIMPSSRRTAPGIEADGQGLVVTHFSGANPIPRRMSPALGQGHLHFPSIRLSPFHVKPGFHGNTMRTRARSFPRTWKIRTETLKGSETQNHPGLAAPSLPHEHSRSSTSMESISKPPGASHALRRREMSSPSPTPSPGILPNLPAPKASGNEHDFQPARLAGATGGNGRQARFWWRYVLGRKRSRAQRAGRAHRP